MDKKVLESRCWSMVRLVGNSGWEGLTAGLPTVTSTVQYCGRIFTHPCESICGEPMVMGYEDLWGVGKNHCIAVRG